MMVIIVLCSQSNMKQYCVIQIKFRTRKNLTPNPVGSQNDSFVGTPENRAGYIPPLQEKYPVSLKSIVSRTSLEREINQVLLVPFLYPNVLIGRFEGWVGLCQRPCSGFLNIILRLLSHLFKLFIRKLSILLHTICENIDGITFQPLIQLTRRTI